METNSVIPLQSAVSPSSARLSFGKIAQTFKIGEVKLKEYYPELTGAFLKFIEANNEALHLNDHICLSQLSSLTRKNLGQLPEGSAFETVVESHGWNGREFIFSNPEYDLNSLNKQMGSLFYAHFKLAASTTSKRSLEIDDAKPVDNIPKEDKMICSFCPDALLFSLLTVLNADSKNRNESVMQNMLIQEPQSISFRGACLLADISGFTKLSGKFSSRGSAGLEELHATASDYLGKFAKIVYAHGGDVIAFAGDALVCIFRALDDDADEAEKRYNDCSRRATVCSLALKELHTADLTAHIGVSCGDLSFSNLGGYKEKWVYLLSGGCISELSRCIDAAGPRSVVVTEKVHSILLSTLEKGDSIQYDDIKDIVGGAVVFQITGIRSQKGPTLQFSSRLRALSGSNLDVKLVKKFVPQPVLNAISFSTLDTISEIREVTTLFLKIDSFCGECLIDPLSLQTFVCMTQKAIALSGGFLRQFLEDDKGIVLIVMWGIPSFTYTDTSNRALACAAALQLGAADLSYKCSIGITTGSVFCGIIGSEYRRDFVGIGDTVNLAARLMCKAKGDIYVDGATYNGLSISSKPHLSRTLGMELKGVSGVVYAYKCDELAHFNALNATFSIEKYREYVPKSVFRAIEDQLKLAYVTKRSKSCSPFFSPSHKHSSFLSPVSKASSLSLSPVSPGALSDGPHANVVVIKDKYGSCKNCAAKLFCKKAYKKQLSVLNIKVKESDKGLQFSVMRKLFVELVGSDSIDTFDKQLNCLLNLLEEISWSGQMLEEDLRLQMLVDALGFGWEVTDEIADSIGVLNKSHPILRDDDYDQFYTYFDGEVPTIEKLDCDDISTFEVLHEVLFVLMRKHKPAVCIEDAQFCDKFSWISILLLTTLPLATPVLITVDSLPSSSASANEINDCFKAVSTVDESEPLTMVVADLDDSISITEFPNTCMSDDDCVRRTFKLLVDGQNTVVLDNTQLDFKEVEYLLCNILKLPILPRSLVDMALVVSGGNPFWCKEIGDYIAASGEENFMKLSQGDKSGKHPLRVLIICRLEKLTTEQQVVLKCASIAGEDFTQGLLAVSLPFKLIQNLGETLQCLEAHSFIAKKGQEDATQYAFCNSSIRSIIYRLTPPLEAKKIHLQLARHIEKSYTSSALIRMYPLLRYHYGKCGADGLASTFKYTCKVALSHLEKEALTDCLVVIKEAFHLCNSHADYSTLLDLVDQALVTERVAFFKSRNRAAKNKGTFTEEFERIRVLVVKKLDSLPAQLFQPFALNDRDKKLVKQEVVWDLLDEKLGLRHKMKQKYCVVDETDPITSNKSSLGDAAELEKWVTLPQHQACCIVS